MNWQEKISQRSKVKKYNSLKIIKHSAQQENSTEIFAIIADFSMSVCIYSICNTKVWLYTITKNSINFRSIYIQQFCLTFGQLLKIHSPYYNKSQDLSSHSKRQPGILFPADIMIKLLDALVFSKICINKLMWQTSQACW